MKLLAVDGPFRGQEIEFLGDMVPAVGEWVAMKMLGVSAGQLESYEYEVVKAGPYKVCRVRAAHIYDVDPVASPQDKPDEPSDLDLLKPLAEAIRDGRLHIDGKSFGWNGHVLANDLAYSWWPPKPE